VRVSQSVSTPKEIRAEPIEENPEEAVEGDDPEVDHPHVLEISKQLIERRHEEDKDDEPDHEST
jgi:hypothetical protein